MYKSYLKSARGSLLGCLHGKRLRLVSCANISTCTCFRKLSAPLFSVTFSLTIVMIVVMWIFTVARVLGLTTSTTTMTF